jgi:hypothetical protein
MIKKIVHNVIAVLNYIIVINNVLLWIIIVYNMIQMDSVLFVNILIT